MSDFTNAIIEQLKRIAPSEIGLPVFCKTSRGTLYLGNAETHLAAEHAGLAQGITCDKISRAQIEGRVVFLLH